MMWTKRARIQRDIEELAKCNATPGQGLTRFSLTAEDRAARTYLKQEMKACGLVVFEDAAGNLVGRREGQLPGAPVVMIGSHFDSVKGGGNFDGPAGVSVALETARVLFERGIKTRYPIEVVAMIEEEGARFNASLYGSRAMAGKIDVAQLQERKDEKGISMFDALKDFGFNPEEIALARRPQGSVKAYLELHIEQGPILEAEGLDVGIVREIVGIHDLKIKITGRQGHAGTIPMNLRSDALNMAAKAIAQIAELAIEAGEGTVATVGWIAVKPGGFNIIPGEAEFSVDIRSGKLEHVDTVTRRVGEVLSELTQGTGVTYEIASLMKVAPVQMATDIVNKELAICEKLGLKSRLMLSGAGHDAMVMAGIADVGLLFVPSLAGRSHCPEEWTDYEQLQKGAEVYLHTVMDLAETDV
jgi:allantoate deiminase